jgi:hypothetical protein
MDDGAPWDLASMREEEFEHRAVYLVPDAPPENGPCPDRAEESLPRNLVLKPSEALSDVSTFFSFLNYIIVYTLVCYFYDNYSLSVIDVTKESFIWTVSLYTIILEAQ